MILVVDFGSQYTQLIARRIRETNVYCEILPCTVSVDEVREKAPAGIVLSGGPASVYVESAPKLRPTMEGPVSGGGVATSLTPQPETAAPKPIRAAATINPCLTWYDPISRS